MCPLDVSRIKQLFVRCPLCRHVSVDSVSPSLLWCACPQVLVDYPARGFVLVLEGEGRESLRPNSTGALREYAAHCMSVVRVLQEQNIPHTCMVISFTPSTHFHHL
jgi:hypothetical protein